MIALRPAEPIDSLMPSIAWARTNSSELLAAERRWLRADSARARSTATCCLGGGAGGSGEGYSLGFLGPQPTARARRSVADAAVTKRVAIRNLSRVMGVSSSSVRVEWRDHPICSPSLQQALGRRGGTQPRRGRR